MCSSSASKLSPNGSGNVFNLDTVLTTGRRKHTRDPVLLLVGLAVKYRDGAQVHPPPADE